MMKVLGASVTTLVLVAAGFGLLAFSPTSCGCITPREGLFRLANLDYSNEKIAQNYSAEQIESGIRQHMLGEQMTPGAPYQYFPECSAVSVTTFTCRVVTDTSKLLSRDFIITVTTDDKQRMTDVHVRRSWSWL